MISRPNRHPAILLGVAMAFVGSSALAQDVLKPAIWIDPDGCEHWVIDDGAEGYMSPHLNRDGTPVCHAKDLCGVLDTDVLFAFDSSDVTNEGRRRIARILQDSPARAYIIAGHTDNQGAYEYNVTLSEERANAVAQIARDMGVPISDVTGFGERWPVASNATDAGRKKNRRVEVLCLK